MPNTDIFQACIFEIINAAPSNSIAHDVALVAALNGSFVAGFFFLPSSASELRLQLLRSLLRSSTTAFSLSQRQLFH